MNKLFKKSLAWGLVCLTVVLLSVSCKTPKNISYFQDIRNGQTDQILHSHGIQLKPGDAISIVVKSKSVELTNALNLPVTAQVIGTPEEVSLRQSQGISSYTIDDNGDIVPAFGMICIRSVSGGINPDPPQKCEITASGPVTYTHDGTRWVQNA